MLALIIDDSRSMRLILGRIIRRLGFETLEAEHGRAALEVMEQPDPLPDVCLVDWNMPEMDGLAFVEEVRGRPEWADVSLVMVSSESEHGQVVRALAAGADEYVTKPFTPEGIAEKLALVGLRPDRALT